MKNIHVNMKNNRKGFTILELLLATTVFSTILLVLTTTIIRLNGTYYQAIIRSQTLNATKNIVSTVTQQIQTSSSDFVYNGGSLTWSFTAASVNPKLYEAYYCIGDNEYIYQIGGLVVATPGNYDEAYYGLILKNDAQCKNPGPSISQNNNDLSSTTPGLGSGNVFNLVPNNMRLLKFDIVRVPNTTRLYKVDVKMAYGNDGNYDNDPIDANYQKCYPKAYYCAVIELVNYVEKLN